MSAWKFVPVSIVCGYVTLMLGSKVALFVVNGLMPNLPEEMVNHSLYVIPVLLQVGLSWVVMYLLTFVPLLKRTVVVK